MSCWPPASLDHLFLDQDGVPTLVEVKRATDSRTRREVVAQMLDYAANAVLYWPIEEIQAAFRETCRQASKDPEQTLKQFLADQPEEATSASSYWDRVKTNLAAERIRLVFVADQIPRELQRIIEFLNGQMDRAEVLAVELRQFVGKDLRTLVPHVIGQTTKSEKAKGTRPPPQVWDEASFLAAVETEGGVDLLPIARRLIEWANGIAPIRWGSGGRYATFNVASGPAEGAPKLMRIYANGGIQLYLPTLPDPADRDVLRTRLDNIPGFDLSKAEGYPTGSMSALADPKAWQQFTAAYDWVLSRLGAPEGTRKS